MRTYFTLVMFTLLIFISGCWKEEIDRSYYSNGALKTEVYVLNGLLNGLGTTYYENGKKKTSANYKNGILNGKSSEYSSDGIIKATAHYVNGVLDGKSTSHNNLGQTIKIVYIRKGLVEYITDNRTGKVTYGTVSE